MRCYNRDRFWHESQSCRSSEHQSLNKSFKSGTKPNKIWNNKGDDKSPKTQLKIKGQKRKVSHKNIWRRKSEEEIKKDDIALGNEEINNKKMMSEGPNKECESQNEIDQAQEREVPIE
jgi:hypothetical protein